MKNSYTIEELERPLIEFVDISTIKGKIKTHYSFVTIDRKPRERASALMSESRRYFIYLCLKYTKASLSNILKHIGFTKQNSHAYLRYLSKWHKHEAFLTHAKYLSDSFLLDHNRIISLLVDINDEFNLSSFSRKEELKTVLKCQK